MTLMIQGVGNINHVISGELNSLAHDMARQVICHTFAIDGQTDETDKDYRC